MAKRKKSNLAKKSITPAARKEFQAALTSAKSGKLPWLHNLVVQAGYLGNLDRMTAREIGVIFSVTPQAVGLWHSNNKCPRSPDGHYNLQEVLPWRVKYLVDQAVEKQIAQSGGDPLLMGDDSPALEKYRIAKTEEVEFKLAVLKNKYYDAEQVNTHWRELGNQIGNAVHKIEKKNPDLAKILKDAISKFKFTTYPLEEK